MSLQSTNPIVLVVDDSPDSLGMINSALNQAGYTVLVSLNGEQALNIIEQIIPDVVLMDAVMPIVDGFECCQRMREFLPLTPIIFMTGLTDVEHTVKAFECGGNDYITKPIKPAELLARIASHIQKANMITNARAALDTAKQLVISFNNAGDVVWMTPDTQKIFELNKIDKQQLRQQILAAFHKWETETGKKSDLVLHNDEQSITLRYFKNINHQEHLLRVVLQASIMDSGLLETVLPITKREAEVLLWVAHGKTNRDIADILSLSPRTINKHLELIYQKIQVDNRTAATSIAIQALLGLPV